MPINILYALDTGLQQVLAEGLEARIARTAESAAAVRKGLRQLGFEMFVDDEWASPITTSVRPYEKLPADQLAAYLRQSHNIHISGGLAELHGVIFRIGHMGRAIERAEVELLLRAIEGALRLEGVEVEEGAALEGIWAEVPA